MPEKHIQSIISKNAAILTDQTLYIIMDHNISYNCWQQEQDHARQITSESIKTLLNPDQWLAETKRLMVLAQKIMYGKKDILSRPGWLTEDKYFPKGNNILIADSLCHIFEDHGCLVEKTLQARLVHGNHMSAYPDVNNIIRDIPPQNIRYLVLGWFESSDKEIPLFDAYGNIATMNNRTHIPHMDQYPGYICAEKETGTHYLCLSGMNITCREVHTTDTGKRKHNCTPSGKGKYIYLRMTQKLEQKLFMQILSNEGMPLSVDNFVKKMALHDKKKPWTGKLQVRCKPKQFTERLQKIVDMNDISPKTVCSWPVFYGQDDKKGNEFIHFEYTINVPKTK